MVSLESCACGWAALCSSMSCARRSAQAMPAGPPPTITTSASSTGCSIPSSGVRKIIWTSALRFLDFLCQCRDDLKEVAHHSHVGDLEDRRFGIFVHGDDVARALHAYQVLDGAADAQRKIEVRIHGLAARSDLPLHGQPARVADGTRGRQLSAHRLGQRLCDRDVLLLFDAPPDRDDDSSLRQVHRLPRLAERGFGPGAHLANRCAHPLYWGSTRPQLRRIGAISTALEARKPGSV